MRECVWRNTLSRASSMYRPALKAGMTTLTSAADIPERLPAELLDQIVDLLRLHQLGIELGGATQRRHRIGVPAEARIGHSHVIAQGAVVGRSLHGSGERLLRLGVGTPPVLNPSQGVQHLRVA